MVCFAFSTFFKARLDISVLSSRTDTLGYPIKTPSSSFLEILSEVELKALVKELDFGSTSNIVEFSGQTTEIGVC